MDKRSNQVFTIIICIALIATVIFMNVFIKDKDSSKADSFLASETKTVEAVEDVAASTLEENNTSSTITTAEYKPISEIDTSLYEENPSSEAIPEGVTDIQFAFTNGEVLYNQDFSSGIYKNMKEEIQKFINENLSDSDSITEIEILEDTIQEDKKNKKLTFDTKLNDGKVLTVEIDLYTFEYKFKIK